MASANHGNTGRRKSSVWNYFHRVIVSGGTGAGVMAMCKRCSSTFQASAKKHGTSHLRRHAQSSCCAKRAADRAVAAAPATDGDSDGGFAAKWLEGVLVEPELDFADRVIIAGGDELVDDVADRAAAAAPAADGDSDGVFAKWLEGVLVEPELDFADRVIIAGGDELVDDVADRAPAAAPAADGDSDGVFAKWLEGVLVEPELDFADRLTIAGGDELVDDVADVPAAGDHGRLSPNFIPDALPQAPASSSMRFFQKKRERSASLASQEGGTKDNDNSSRA